MRGSPNLTTGSVPGGRSAVRGALALGLFIVLSLVYPAFSMSQETVQDESESATRNSVSISDAPSEQHEGVGGGEAAPSKLWAWFRWLQSALQAILEGLHGATNSWPAALILLGILVRAVLLPFTIFSTRHQIRTNQTMALIKPEIESIKEKHAADAEAREEAMLVLYKRHGLSPLAQMQGCLPLMIQIPILIALFRVILSLEAIHDVSFLWIDDLARPDALFSWGVSLPWLGDSFNVLPLLMFGAHVLIAQVSTKAKLTKSTLAMPALIALLFYPFPSGALLYWVTGSYVQILETVVIRSKVRGSIL